MATLGPQIVSQSYGNLLKFLPIGEDGVTTNQVQITDGKGKVTPLYLATGSVLVDNEFTASAEVVFSGLTQVTQTNIVCIDGSGRLYFQNSASFQDNDWTVGSSYMTASGQTSVYIPNRLENGLRNKAVGLQSHAEGADTIADGNYSHAEGRNVSSSGTWSHAEGNETKAQQNYSHAEGDGTVSYGLGAHAEGYQTLASGTYSHAEGSSTLAKSLGSHAEGRLTTASAFYAHAEGKGGVASGEISHAEGHYTVASGWHSHAEGNKTLASGTGAHSGGTFTTASLDYQTVVGQYNVGNYPDGNDTFVVGTGADNNTREDAFKVRANTHEVIIAQETGPLFSAGQTRGLYFGEPTSLNSTRIMSSNTGFGAAMSLEWYSGISWNSFYIASNAALFVPTP